MVGYVGRWCLTFVDKPNTCDGQHKFSIVFKLCFALYSSFFSYFPVLRAFPVEHLSGLPEVGSQTTLAYFLNFPSSRHFGLQLLFGGQHLRRYIGSCLLMVPGAWCLVSCES
jgi:hypothetical protein